MNQHVKPEALAPETERTLSTLRLIYVRLGLIRHEIKDIGIALKNGRVSPEHAQMLAEQAAPGCFEVCADFGDGIQ